MGKNQQKFKFIGRAVQEHLSNHPETAKEDAVRAATLLWEAKVRDRLISAEASRVREAKYIKITHENEHRRKEAYDRRALIKQDKKIILNLRIEKY